MMQEGVECCRICNTGEDTAGQGREGRMFGKSRGKHGWSGWSNMILSHVFLQSHRGNTEGGVGEHRQFVRSNITFSVPALSTLQAKYQDMKMD